MGIASSINSVFDTIGRARSAQATYTRLSNLSDKALADQGIAREDIPQIALEQL